MAGRRRHERFAVGGWEGALRVRRDVVVESQVEGVLSVISDTPGVPDEILTLDLIGVRTSESLTVQVVESRPVVDLTARALHAGRPGRTNRPAYAGTSSIMFTIWSVVLIRA